MTLSIKEGPHCRQPAECAFWILPLLFLRTQAHSFAIIKWKYILELQLTQEMSNNMEITEKGENIKYESGVRVWIN